MAQDKSYFLTNTEVLLIGVQFTLGQGRGRQLN